MCFWILLSSLIDILLKYIPLFMFVQVTRSARLIFFPFRLGSVQPIYINLIRDPLARLVSGYYFRRFGDYREGERTWGFTGTDETKNQVCVKRARN